VSGKGYYLTNDNGNSNVDYVMCDRHICELLDLQSVKECSKTTQGKLILNGSVAKFCINSNLMVGFSPNDDFLNFIFEDNGNSIFSNGKIVITITKNSIEQASITEGKLFYILLL